ncbi:uncharacterized protein TNCV_2381621 [Trichonephila clavipes]|nr:uncharacterized protein TNCV_2381621 [Trichonephila clavipes]
MGDHSVNRRVPFLPEHRLSPYVYMERIRGLSLLSNVHEIDNYGGGGLMVWAGNHVEWSVACDPEFILMDNNARPHTALLVDEFLESEDINRMDWPSRSPDLSPIEHV